MRRLLALAAALLIAALPAGADERIVTGLSQNRVQITANFDGSEILIYGAVKRDSPMPADSRLEVIVTVEGPATPVAVRRKGRVAGIWVNNASVMIDSAPSFYAVATTRPIAEMSSPAILKTAQVGIASLILPETAVPIEVPTETAPETTPETAPESIPPVDDTKSDGVPADEKTEGAVETPLPPAKDD